MRRLPVKPNPQQRRIIDHAAELWGKLDRHAMNVALYMMKKRKGLNLTEEELGDVWLAQQNMWSKVGE